MLLAAATAGANNESSYEIVNITKEKIVNDMNNDSKKLEMLDDFEHLS